MSNAQRFLDAYAAIERAMNEMAGSTRYVSFSQLLSRCVSSSRIIRSNLENLREYNELRNAIVHQRGEEMEIIAQPSDSVVAEIERIAVLLQNNRTLMDYASSPVKTGTSDWPIEKAFELMETLQSGKLPIYDSGHYTGILTMHAIAKWSFDNSSMDIKVRDAIDKSESLNRVVFLSRNTPVKEAVHTFEKAFESGKNLLAIIVSEHGRQDEQPLGILTLYDLPRILSEFL